MSFRRFKISPRLSTAILLVVTLNTGFGLKLYLDLVRSGYDFKGELEDEKDKFSIWLKEGKFGGSKKE